MKKQEPLIKLYDGQSKDFVRALFYASQVRELKKELKELKEEQVQFIEKDKKNEKEIRELENLLSKDFNKHIIIKYRNIIKGTVKKSLKYKKRIENLSIMNKKLRETNEELIIKLSNGEDIIQ